MGSTDAGKSTLINFLMGNKLTLESKKNKRNDEGVTIATKKPIILVKNLKN